MHRPPRKLASAENNRVNWLKIARLEAGFAFFEASGKSEEKPSSVENQRVSWLKTGEARAKNRGFASRRILRYVRRSETDF